MSISNNIDGSVGGGNQLLDFISLVTNPKVYEAKLKALQDATAENQKFVELLAPATEILDLRDKTEKAKIAAETALDEAKSKANDLVKKAQDKAEAIVAEAQAKADQLNSEAEVAAADAKAAQAELRRDASAAKKAKDEFDKLTDSLKAQQSELTVAQVYADALAKDLEETKADLIAKHTAFIKSL